MISYAITVKDELQELKTLVERLLQYKGDTDEIVIVQDITANNVDVKTYLETQSDVKKFDYAFENHFAKMKNFMISRCKQDWIFNIDADELPHESLLGNLPAILEMNTDVDAIWVPRINIVNGITPEHIAKWGWVVNEKGWINWPNDAQCRIYKNSRDIYWSNPVHEQLAGTGITKISKLPDVEELSLYHIKDIKRQEQQNSYYSQLQK